MPLINIEVRNKKAISPQDHIVCGNADYQIGFHFDEEWNEHEVKTARFIYGGRVVDVVFQGDVVDAPVISNAKVCAVGVFAGDLRTTTPAFIPCDKSIRCGSGAPVEPTPDVYDQIMEMLNQGGGNGAPGKDGEDGEDGFSPIVTLTETDEGVDIAVTDKEGTKTATVKHGEKGEKGDPGEAGGSSGGGMTVEQVNALDGLFKIAAYKEDASAAYAAFRSAFGLADDPVVPDEPDVPVVTTYTVTNNLTGVTNSNGNTTASGFYSGHLGAAEGYNIVVTITMGGVDVTESVYTEDGTILITEVTGDIVITATAELAGAPVLYQLANTPVTCNADLYEDTGLTFGSGTAEGYTKAWTMVMKVSNMTAGNLWCVNGNNGLRSNYESRWNGEVGNNAVHLSTYICATMTRPSITQKEPNSICVVITKEAMSPKTATVHYLNYAGELQSDELVGTYGQLNGSAYAGNMMVGGQTAADFVGTIEEFTIYEGVATEDQIKKYLGVA